MADQATISGTSNSAPHRAASSIAGLAHDVVSLGELQYRLASCDLKEMLRGLILPAILLVVTVLTLLGAIFTAYLVGAYMLVDWAGWTQVAAFATSAGAGLLLSCLLAAIAVWRFRGSVRKLDRSKSELAANVAALKAMLKDHDRQREDARS